MKKDTVAPTVALNAIAGPWSIKAEVTAQDELSGIYSYEIQYKKKNESNWKTGETKITTEGSVAITAKDLESLTEYEVKVIVKDKAGNEVTQAATATTTKEPQVGDYIGNFKPDLKQYTVSKELTGYSKDWTSNIDGKFWGTNWKILSINKETNKVLIYIMVHNTDAVIPFNRLCWVL